VVRPIANPFALGFLGLAGATLVLAGQELAWIPSRQTLEVAVIILIAAPVLQLIACVFGFLGRDPVAATGMGTLAATWGAIGVVHALSPPDAPSQALGTLLFLSAAGVLLSALLAAETKLLPAAVMALTAGRFFTTGLYEVTGNQAIKAAAGVVGCLLTALAVYAAFALELEGVQHRSVLPTFRRGSGKRLLYRGLGEQLRTVAGEPGVRTEL
jgi:succinate-acetate transporter protein